MTTAHGACIVKIHVSEAQRRGSVFVPIHWTGESASCARVGDLVAPHTDPNSGQPEAKATAAAIAPVNFSRRGVVHVQRNIELPPGTWWTRVVRADGVEYRLLTCQGPMLWHDLAYRLLDSGAVVAELLDLERGTYQAASFIDGEIAARLYVGPGHLPLEWQPLAPPAQAGTPQTDAAVAALAQTEGVVCACPRSNRGPRARCHRFRARAKCR